MAEEKRDPLGAPRRVSAAEHFAWSRQRALDLVDAGDETGAMASLEQGPG